MGHNESRTRPAPVASDWMSDDAIFRRLVEDVPDYAIFLLDAEGVVRSWNRGAERIKGYRAEEIIGRHFSTFYPQDAIDSGWPQHELLVAREIGRFEDEGWRVRKDGSRFWANVILTRILDDDGSVRGFSKITRDLTVRRAHEDLLRLSEERFRLLVEGVRDYAIFMLDPEGHVASWNTGAQQAKGYEAAEIIGRHFSAFYPPEVVATGRPAHLLAKALAEGRCEDEGWRVRKDGTRFWASVVISALHDEAGHHIGYAKVTRDLTDKRRVSALEDEGRRVTTFLAMLGHELRNPLAPIANAVSIMQLESIESARLRTCRDVISRQLQQITRLVDDLLDVGRITAGKIHLELEPVELGGVLGEAVEAIEPYARSRLHTLVLDLQGAPAWVAGDRARLLQIASNLLNNAAKFTPRGGRIVATLRRTPTHAELSIADNGPGIPESQLRDIFNLFVQLDQDVARTQGGLGLGLSLVQQLITLHGGDVSVFSAGEGRGAEFIVKVPLVSMPRQEPGASALASPPEARRVLVVDDNRDAADTMALLLKTLGYRTRTAYDARTALESARISRPDLAFLDIGLPDMDGWQLARALRDEHGDAIAMIAITGYGQEQDRDATLASGFRDHLTKPLSSDMLIAAIARALPAARLSDA